MARFYHDGGRYAPPILKHKTLGTVVKVPPEMVGSYGGEYAPCKEGAQCVALFGYGFWTVGPGEYVDLPHGLSPEQVKAAAPGLLTEEEAIEKGMAKLAISEPVAVVLNPTPKLPVKPKKESPIITT